MEFTDIYSGYGIVVTYNSYIVCLRITVTNFTANNNDRPSSIKLPDNVKIKDGANLYIVMNMMGSNWIPTDKSVYLDFSSLSQSPAVRVSDGSVSNAVLQGMFTFPRSIFDIT